MSNDDEKKKKKSNEGLVKPSIRLLMIRHAESKNNEVYRKAHSLFKGGTPEFDIKGWNDFVDEHRSSDPGISSTGELQAEKLKEYLVPHLDNQSSHPIRLITSPMRRTLATILPTLQNLKGDASIIVNGLYFESEGCHIKDKPLPGMNQAEIKEFLSSATASKPPTFVGFDEDPTKGWYAHGTGPETRAQSESRAASFYNWLCDYLDLQLQAHDIDEDLFDAGVSLDEEHGEHESDKLSPRLRRRRTAVMIGHGDFMSLVLKRIVSGFGHSIENDGVPHRSAFVHFNTGITELEYFGKGRFLMMSSNSTPHLQNFSLLTGGGLKDGWSYLVPRDDIMLYEEITSKFADEHEKHIQEQIEALRNLYVDDEESGTHLRRRGSSMKEIETTQKQNELDSDSTEMIFVVKRGLQVAGSIAFDESTGFLSHLAVRPTAKNAQVESKLIKAVKDHAVKMGIQELFVSFTDKTQKIYEEEGFTSCDNNQNILKLSVDVSTPTPTSML